MRQIVLDTETTGISVEAGHRVIEIGCLELIDRKLTKKHFHCYVNPEREIDAGALAVHGISNEFLNDKPLFKNIVNDLMDFISGAELIIHNAPFDIGFINQELLLAEKNFSVTDHCGVVDTLQMARQLHVGQRNSLDALCKRYAIDLSKREFHGALLDAHLLAQVYLVMTGGQGNFFDSVSTNNQNLNHGAVKHKTLNLSQDCQLIVQKADADELAAHEKYLHQLQQTSKCLWLTHIKSMLAKDEKTR